MFELLSAPCRTSSVESNTTGVEDSKARSVVAGDRSPSQAEILCSPAFVAVCAVRGRCGSDELTDGVIDADVDVDVVGLTASEESDGVEMLSNCEGKPAYRYH